jgi:uncharacterized repeat protein (TIGR03943 family)
MSRTAQNLVLALVGVALLRITVASNEYLNYVRPGFRILLIAAAVVMLLLGAVGGWREAGPHGRRPADGNADDHHHHHHGHGLGGRGPRTAWLLFLPILGVFLVAPPALGSFTASRATARSAPAVAAPGKGYRPLPEGSPAVLSIGEYVGRAFAPEDGLPATLPGHRVVLTGFVMPSREGGWYLTRLHIACCAADAIAMQVVVRGAAMPPKDAWVQVTGLWTPRGKAARSGLQPITALGVRRVPKPHDPYE